MSIDRVGTLTVDDFTLTDTDARVLLRQRYEPVEAEEAPAAP